jgi:hypothetical protein
MKTFTVKIEFIGLAGKYVSEVVVKAKNAKSAEKKASLTIGNRDGWIVGVKEEGK